MSALFSSISGEFSRSIILGAFFPAAVFVLLALLLAWPLLPPDAGLVRQISVLDTEWQLVAITALTVTVTGLLYNLNIPILRLYEGYPWQEALLFNYFRQRQQRRYAALEHRVKALDALLAKRGQMPKYRHVTHINNLLADEAFDNLLELRRQYPTDISLVLPTELGNRIRKAETYPQREYGIAAVSMWPRLLAVAESSYITALENMQIALNFTLNGSLLSALLALLILVLGLSYPLPLSDPWRWIPWLTTITAFGLLSWLFYHAAIGRAAAWSRLVEGAFDLYRWKLLEQLGFKEMPKTRGEERRLWNRISRQMIIGDGPTGPYIRRYDTLESE